MNGAARLKILPCAQTRVIPTDKDYNVKLLKLLLRKSCDNMKIKKVVNMIIQPT